jgi:hypothetical protein
MNAGTRPLAPCGQRVERSAEPGFARREPSAAESARQR